MVHVHSSGRVQFRLDGGALRERDQPSSAS